MSTRPRRPARRTSKERQRRTARRKAKARKARQQDPIFGSVGAAMIGQWASQTLASVGIKQDVNQLTEDQKTTLEPVHIVTPPELKKEPEPIIQNINISDSVIYKSNIGHKGITSEETLAEIKNEVVKIIAEANPPPPPKSLGGGIRSEEARKAVREGCLRLLHEVSEKARLPTHRLLVGKLLPEDLGRESYSLEFAAGTKELVLEWMGSGDSGTWYVGGNSGTRYVGGNSSGAGLLLAGWALGNLAGYIESIKITGAGTRLATWSHFEIDPEGEWVNSKLWSVSGADDLRITVTLFEKVGIDTVFRTWPHIYVCDRAGRRTGKGVDELQ